MATEIVTVVLMLILTKTLVEAIAMKMVVETVTVTGNLFVLTVGAIFGKVGRHVLVF